MFGLMHVSFCLFPLYNFILNGAFCPSIVEFGIIIYNNYYDAIIFQCIGQSSGQLFMLSGTGEQKRWLNFKLKLGKREKHVCEI